nr:uncharacterized protein LOC125994688 [Syngnathus scovelli]
MFNAPEQAMRWCPWKRNAIAPGGGWKDGKLRIWDTESASCVSRRCSDALKVSHASSATDSAFPLVAATTCLQICSFGHLLFESHLELAFLMCGHLLWLRLLLLFAGHSGRVLHVASKRDTKQLLTVGADERLRMWNVSFPGAQRC